MELQTVGIADSAFKKQGIEKLTLPDGMMVDYNDTVTHVVTRRGNFLIGAGAFDGNELTSLDLPEGVIYIGPSSFARNKLKSVTIPHTFWWLENSAFAVNEITKVNFSKTCDFQAQIPCLCICTQQHQIRKTSGLYGSSRKESLLLESGNGRVFQRCTGERAGIWRRCLYVHRQ